MGEEKGRGFGMPLDEFVREAYAGLCEGREYISVGAVGTDVSKLQTLVEVRKSIFDTLSDYILAGHKN